MYQPPYTLSERAVSRIAEIAAAPRREIDEVRGTRSDVGINVGINVGIKLSDTENAAVEVIKQNPRVIAAELAEGLSVTKRQAERIISALKSKAGLKRKGARKNGEWFFEE